MNMLPGGRCTQPAKKARKDLKPVLCVVRSMWNEQVKLHFSSRQKQGHRLKTNLNWETDPNWWNHYTISFLSSLSLRRLRGPVRTTLKKKAIKISLHRLLLKLLRCLGGHKCAGTKPTIVNVVFVLYSEVICRMHGRMADSTPLGYFKHSLHPTPLSELEHPPHSPKMKFRASSLPSLCKFHL